MNIILFGLSMSGKTTIGKKIAEKFNRTFIDTDLLIERAYGQSTKTHRTCRQICADEGELFFRELERQQIESLKGSSKCVIALGGGSLCNQASATFLQSIGHLIYLKTPADILWQRIQMHGTPAYLDQSDPKTSFDKLVKRRIPLFEKMAHTTIETSHMNEEDIVASLSLIIKAFENLHFETRSV